MSSPPRVLPHRLERDPSLAAEFRQAIVYASVPLFIIVLAAWSWFEKRPATSLSQLPIWISVAGGVLLLMTSGFIANVIVKAVRALRGIAPVVEIESQPLRPGQASRVRIYEPATAALEKLDVYLIAEAIRVDRVPLTTASPSGWRFTEFVREQRSLVAAEGEALSGTFDRTVALTVPLEAADHAWRWQILIVSTRARGIPREDRYPVAVSTGAEPQSILDIRE